MTNIDWIDGFREKYRNAEPMINSVNASIKTLLFYSCNSMSTTKNIIAIGRSRYLYDGIRLLVKHGYAVKAIITAEAYQEYDIKHHHFQSLAKEIGAAFFMTNSLDMEEIKSIIRDNQVRAAISANWKYTIQKPVLDLFECGNLNFHLGNLPDYKGNATVNWTIINGEGYINGNIHRMDPELDAGIS